MLQPVLKVLLSVVVLFVAYASTGGGRALGQPASAEASELTPIQDDDDDGAAQLTCGGHVCQSGQLCCSCRLGLNSPLTFFCHTPDYCPHGSICQIPPP